MRAIESQLRRRRPEPLPPGQPPTVAAVVERLRAVQAEGEPGDGVAAFNGMYLRVTELVGSRIAEGAFVNREFMTRLDIVFATLYLDQLTAAPDSVARAWAPVFERRSHRCEPIQFALAGMNAHINHDLPVALVRTCRQLGLTLDRPGVQQDYDAVSAILAEVHEEVRQSFLRGVALDVDRSLAPVVSLVGNWSIARARDAAWVNAGVLWQIDGIPHLRKEFLDTLGGSVGMVGRYLLTPVAELV